MYSKKFLITNIVDILNKYSDEEHRLTQKDIIDKLRNEYDMVVDRKSISRNFNDIIQNIDGIEYDEKIRMIPDTDSKTGECKIDPKTGEKIYKESSILTNFYIEHKFTDAELRLLIDSVMFSKNIPENQCADLIGKLTSLSNSYFKARVRHISRIPAIKTDNAQVFYNIDLLDEAIGRGRKVSFKYLDYGTDKKMHARLNAEGKVREYIINPYQMVISEGKYYLICNYDRFNDISNYRVDRITDIKILDDKVKPFESLKGSDGNRFNLEEYMKEHIYMYASDSVRAKLRIIKPMISDIIDTFGKDVKFSNETEKTVDVVVRVNERSLFQYAKNYAPDVMVLEPLALRDKVKEEILRAMNAYEE